MDQNRNQDRVSVVIPTYERPEFLEGAIKTALRQTYDNIDVIVVDDGSSQQYAQSTVADFPDTVTSIRHEKNKGLSAARNTGIIQSKGDFIAFLDDDDRWDKRKIARQVEAIEKDERAGLATCLVAAISPDNEVVHCETSVPSGDCSDELLIGNSIGTPSRVLVRREAIDDIGTFDESLPTKQDWDFYIRLCQNWRVAAVEDHLCFRTVHESMSSSPIAVQRDKQAVSKKHEELIRANDRWEQAQTAIAEEVGRTYLETGDLEQGREHLKRSLSLPTVRRLLLLFLSFTHPTVVNNAILMKRKISLLLSECDELEMTPNEIPGLRAVQD